MEKQEFLEQVNVSGALAEVAWETAEGDEERAAELLAPSTLFINGKFTDTGGRFGGAFSIRWDYEFDELVSCLSIVTGGEDGVDIPLELDPDKFYNRLEMRLQTGQRMGGNTETLHSALEEAIQNEESETREAIDEGELGKLSPLFKLLIQDSLEINKPNVNLNVEFNRKIEEMEEEAEGLEEEEDEKEQYEYVLPCEVEINPVRGIPLARIQVGDIVYVSVGNVQGEQEKIARVLQKRRDDSGMVPARLVSRNATEAGTMELIVQFGENVYGKARSGKDVSLLVPSETAEKRSPESEELDPVEFFIKYWVILVALLFMLIILYIAQALAL